MLIASTGTPSSCQYLVLPYLPPPFLTLVTGMWANPLPYSDGAHSAILSHLRVAGFSLLLALNIVCTLLISYRLWSSAQRVGAAFSARRMNKYYGVLVVIAESAALYTVAVALYLGFFLSDTGVGGMILLMKPQVLVSTLFPTSFALTLYL